MRVGQEQHLLLIMLQFLLKSIELLKQYQISHSFLLTVKMEMFLKNLTIQQGIFRLAKLPLQVVGDTQASYLVLRLLQNKRLVCTLNLQKLFLLQVISLSLILGGPDSIEKEVGADHTLNIDYHDVGWLYEANEVLVACGIYESKVFDVHIIYSTSRPYIGVPICSFS